MKFKYVYVPTLVTHIWLVVRVPVLSEQMTEVQPRVSTEGRLLTMAFFLAIRRVPRARQVVMTAGKPEGQTDEVQHKREVLNELHSEDGKRGGEFR